MNTGVVRRPSEACVSEATHCHSVGSTACVSEATHCHSVGSTACVSEATHCHSVGSTACVSEATHCRCFVINPAGGSTDVVTEIISVRPVN